MNEGEVIVSAPGSLMLFGEHAVLAGSHALVAATDRRLTVKLRRRNDYKIIIKSEEFGHHELSLQTITVTPPYTFILTAINHFLPLLPWGIDIEVISSLSSRQGLGSSASVTTATLLALATLLGKEMEEKELLAKALQVVQKVQGTGSGADLAAAIHGGIILYKMDPPFVQRLPALLPLLVIYSGYKTTTPVVIKQVQALYERYPAIYHEIYQAIDQAVLQAYLEITSADWTALGEIMNIQRALMQTLLVEDEPLHRLLDYLQDQPNVLGAKISGSGLGDCVIALLQKENQELRLPPEDPFNRMKKVAVHLSAQGVMIEKT